LERFEMKTFIVIFLSGCLLLLLNFVPVIMFFGKSASFLYWACLFLIMGLSFKQIAYPEKK